MLTKQSLFLFTLLCLMLSNSLSANDASFDLDRLRNIEISEESDDNVIDQLKILASRADNPEATRQLAKAIVDLVHDGYSIGEYDYLWVLYALLRNAYPDIEGGLVEQDYISIADITLDFLDESTSTGIWVYTDIGQFQMEVYRTAGNGAAWVLRDSEPVDALYYIDKALEYGEGYPYLQDTYVRILLNLDRQVEAFSIVKDVLEQDPNFVDFQDFLTNEEYLRWLKSNDEQSST